MSDLRVSDELIREAFERRAARAAPIGLRGLILEATATAHQRGKPLEHPQRSRFVPTAGGRGAAGDGPRGGHHLCGKSPRCREAHDNPGGRADDSPRSREADRTGDRRRTCERGCRRPYDSRVPPTFQYQADSTIPLETIDTRVNGRGALIAFTFAEDEPYPTAGFGTIAPEAKGVTVSSAQGGQVHDCVADGYSRVREDPALLLLDLRRKAGIGLGETELITFDGRPARYVAVDPAANQCEPSDFHARNFITGILQQPMRLTVPSRLIVTEVDGETMVIQVWAGTEAGLQEWLRMSADVHRQHSLPERRLVAAVVDALRSPADRNALAFVRRQRPPAGRLASPEQPRTSAPHA